MAPQPAPVQGSEPVAMGHGQGSLLPSCWGHGPSTPSPPPSILPRQDQLILASPVRPSGLPIASIAHAQACIAPAPQPLAGPRTPVFAAGAGPACQELGPGAGEPGPSHCAAPTAHAGELLLLDEPGWHSHFLVRFFYIPKKKKTTKENSS